MQSWTIILFGYNESKTIKDVFFKSKDIISQITNDYEIIIIDDGSTDNTLQIATKSHKQNNNIKVINNLNNLGLGGAIKKGLQYAKLNKIMFEPGDNCHKRTEIKKLININNNYDLVLTYYSNIQIRSFFRTLFTKLYTPFLNLIFGLNLPYYNGLGIYKRSILKDINIYTNSFTWQIEVLLKLFKTKNINYILVPTKLDERIDGESKAFNLKNSILVTYSIIRLFLLKFFLKKKN